jgi:hypothetical protein
MTDMPRVPPCSAILAGLLCMALIAQESAPNILLVFREPLKPGLEAEYKAIEDETAQACVELKCPHPHLALEPLTGPREVWWLNAFESDADRLRVEDAYAKNRPLMAALERNSKRKAAVTEPFVSAFVKYRPDLSRGTPWTLVGARFLVVTVTRQDSRAEGSVFDAPDGSRYILKPVKTRHQADAEATRAGQEARVFAIRPYWGLPAKAWLEADPDFWKVNPLARHR